MLARCTGLLRRLSLVALPALLGCQAPAAELEFEVKFFLLPQKVLGGGHRPEKEVLDFFGMKDDPEKLQMQFLDGRGPPLHEKGWDVRFRRLSGEKKLELTFKRRYKVEADLATALAAARKDGFDLKGDRWAPQVEWGYGDRQTLTFSNEKPAGEGLPGVEDSRKVALKHLPEKLERAVKDGWAKGVLAKARL